MPEVSRCSVRECYYNENNLCHANAIQVGSEHPVCDTFISAGQHGAPSYIGRVGACHVSNCEYNRDLSCIADGIDVGKHSEHADCLTFEPR
ncbi:MAG: DUF1540 domain-containing protein [Armatimonadota bacterium]